MNRWKWFTWGMLTVVVVILLGIYIFLKTYVDGFSALDRPSGTEARLADIARQIAMPSAAAKKKNPIQPSPETLADGRAHFADHCATCHSNNGSGDNEIGSRIYPRPPDLRRPDTQKMTDGELFYVIEKGIRWTGMPGWQGSHSDEDNWKLVLFVRHLPKITPEEISAMKKLNPKTPEERQEEQEEEQFLKGQSSDPSSSITQHHH
jgi:mono/diheme cytochrome c family protein